MAQYRVISNPKECYDWLVNYANEKQVSMQLAMREYADLHGASFGTVNSVYYSQKKRLETQMGKEIPTPRPLSKTRGNNKALDEKTAIAQRIYDYQQKHSVTIYQAALVLSREDNASHRTYQNIYYSNRDRIKTKDEPQKEYDNSGFCPMCNEVMTLLPAEKYYRCDFCGEQVPYNGIIDIETPDEEEKTQTPAEEPQTLFKETVTCIVTPEEPVKTDNILEVLSKLVGYSENAGIDLNTVFSGLMPLFQVATQVGELKQELAASKSSELVVEELRKEISAQALKIEELQNQLTRTEQSLNDEQVKTSEVNDKYEGLCMMVSDFLQLESHKKLAQLPDFTFKMKTYVDSQGLVIKSEKVMS